MKKSLLILTTVSLSMLLPAYAGAMSKPSNTKQRLSYAMGYHNAMYLQKHNSNFNLKYYAQGFTDAVAGSTPMISKPKMQSEVSDYMKARIARFKKQYEAQVKEAQSAVTFFKENAKKLNVKSTSSGLQYKVLTAGNGPKPKLSDQVVVDYTGSYPDGTVFDSSAKHGGPATFPVSGVVPGFKEALQMMPVGSTWMVYIPPNLGYGSQGIPGAIKPNAVLVFKIHLRAIKK